MTDEAKEYEGFIDFGQDTDDIHEPQPVPTGAYDLTVESAKAIYEDDGAGNRVMTKVRVMIVFDGQQNAATMFHNIPLPKAADEKKSKDYKIILAKKFYKLFGVPMAKNGINTTDLIGARATQAFVELDSYDKGDGMPPRISNKLNLNNIHV